MSYRSQPITDDDWGDLFARMGAPAEQAIKTVLKKPEPARDVTDEWKFSTGKPVVIPPCDPFEHPCEVCGDFAYWGYGVSLRQEKLGTWYCDQHRPDRRSRS